MSKLDLITKLAKENIHLPKIGLDFILPDRCSNGSSVIDTLVEGWKHGILYFSDIIHSHVDVQYDYWMPFCYCYDDPFMIYFINLHPCACHKYALLMIYRKTEYNPYTYFSIVYMKLRPEIVKENEFIIPNVEDLVGE